MIIDGAKNQEKLTGIDMTKFIAAILILMSHTGILSSYGVNLNMWFINVSFRWCVPFFFICSGFFMPKTGKKLIIYILRISFMYFIWSLFYAVFNHISIASLDIKTLFSGIIPTFWFFPSLILGVFVCFLLRKVLPSFYVCIVACVFYVIALFGDTYGGVVPLGPIVCKEIMKYHQLFFSYSTRDGFFFSSMYISLGMYLRTNEKYLRRIAQGTSFARKAFVLLILFGIEFFEIYVAKLYWMGGDTNVLISTIPLAVVIFVFSYNISVDKDFSLLLRKISTFIYLLHPAIITLFVGKVENSIIYFLMVLIITVCVSLLIIGALKTIESITFRVYQKGKVKSDV